MIIVNGIENVSEILNRQIYTRELAACNKLLKTQRAIKVNIEMSERSPIILELLFDAAVDASEHVLNMNLLVFGELSIFFLIYYTRTRLF